MDLGRTDGGGEAPRATASVGVPASDPFSSAWDDYYREASRRRRAGGGQSRQLREAKRKRRFRERLGIGLSALLVGGLTMVFYFVLTR
jgi:hypothetical protein